MANKLILKMRLLTVTGDVGNRGYTLHAVSGAENERWSQFTPSGQLTFSVTNPAAPDLKPDTDYLVELTEAVTTEEDVPVGKPLEQDNVPVPFDGEDRLLTGAT